MGVQGFRQTPTKKGTEKERQINFLATNQKEKREKEQRGERKVRGRSFTVAAFTSTARFRREGQQVKEEDEEGPNQTPESTSAATRGE